MTFLVKSSLALLISSTLVACAGTKGDFDVEDVQTPQKQINTHTSRDIKTDPREKAQAEGIMKPAYGYGMAIPRRNSHPKLGSPTAEIKLEKIQTLSLQPNGAIPYLEEMMKEGTVAYTHNPNGTKLQKRDLKFVKSGYVLVENKTEITRNEKDEITGFGVGAKGYVYYLGSNPSSSIPTATAPLKYEGTWDFVSDARSSRAHPEGFNKQGAPGRNTGATSFHDNVYDGRLDNEEAYKDKHYKIGHTSHFQVDFANKTLKGQLYKNSNPNFATKDQKVIQRYAIEANIAGNRFSGKAMAQNEDNNKKHELFSSDSSFLEGGFFGPNAEELAGKFLTDDKSLFAVFAAKRESKENEATEKLLDAIKIDPTFMARDLDNFGDARKLLLNGQEISLLDDTSNFTVTKEVTQGNKTYQVNVCCHNLDYTKFGLLSEKTQDQFTHVELFLQGERTATSKIPTTAGEVKYRGTWEGKINHPIVWATSASDKTGASKAEFDVDFAKKEIKGNLTAENGVNPAFIISGKIEGNGFTGKASTHQEGLNLDPGSTLNSNTIHLTDIPVKGGFFGKAAEELGGAFQDEGKKVGVVFGAKRQENQ
ncbi:transferrin-binding protein-like solute binding protein [Pasteurella sp. PK-2025]|uniref:transferrin-binding protein-like solute binding protein n=1 Tax=Pasteurella sp. PK-2025 TaxID=3413133 RepID=UPI003C76919B